MVTPMPRNFLLLFVAVLLLVVSPAGAQTQAGLHSARLKDITSVEGIRDNLLIGYGVVAGLNGTGDRQQTIFSTQSLANMLQRMGVTVSPTAMLVRNIAAVFVTATLPPFSQPGMRIDATISSIGDAKSLDGGTLLLTSLYGPDDQVYGVAQGGMVLGGYSTGARGNTRTVNHPTVARIAGGVLIERQASVSLRDMTTVSLLLHNPDYATARNVAVAINQELGSNSAHVVDSRRVEISGIEKSSDAVPHLLARIEPLPVKFSTPAKVVVNERTGTVVMGADVSLGPCSILHGSLAIDVVTRLEVSQPQPFAQGQTEVVPQTDVAVQESPAQAIHLEEGATVDELIRGLQSIGTTARDIVAILQAIKAAGALQAELEIL